MQEARYELKHPFQYAYKGNMETASFVVMSAPTYRQIDAIAPLKQAIMQAASDVADGSTQPESASEPTEITGAMIIGVLYQSKNDMAKIMQQAATLLKSGVCLIDGSEPFANGTLNKLDMVDFEGIVGEYLANFIMPSLTAGQ
jgi:hypothetical protein